MRRYGVVLYVVGGLGAAPAWGQALPDAPTDNESYAAYCEGTIDYLLQLAKATPTYSTDTATPDLIQKSQNRRHRFEQYLLSTGVMTDQARPNAIFGLAIAQRRGTEDAAQCMSQVTAQCHPATECNVQPRHDPKDPWDLKGPSEKEISCMGERITSCRGRIPECVRELRCQGPDSLPF
jgi:hypothetical protein